MIVRTRSRIVGRMGRIAALCGAVMAVAACAAVLGIDDRELIRDGGVGTSEAGDAPSGDVAIDAPGQPEAGLDGDAADTQGPDAAGKVCDQGQCTNNGGACDMATGTCLFTCTATSCNNQLRICPTGNDCTINCNVAGSCDAVKLKGGKSWTLGCSGSMTCKDGVTCESGRCDFQCTGESCKTGVPISCDAGVCLANCAGDKSCDKGVDFRATEYCGITCSGSPSCNSAGSPVRCFAPDASINCTNVANTCQSGEPQCGFTGPSGYCSVTCGATSSCGANYCCDAGTCIYAGNPARTNSCP